MDENLRSPTEKFASSKKSRTHIIHTAGELGLDQRIPVQTNQQAMDPNRCSRHPYAPHIVVVHLSILFALGARG